MYVKNWSEYHEFYCKSTLHAWKLQPKCKLRKRVWNKVLLEHGSKSTSHSSLATSNKMWQTSFQSAWVGQNKISQSQLYSQPSWAHMVSESWEDFTIHGYKGFKNKVETSSCEVYTYFGCTVIHLKLLPWTSLQLWGCVLNNRSITILWNKIQAIFN